MKIIGHRGAKGLAPENTLASFAKALQHHVDEIECDIRITKDGQPILEHDNKLQAASGEHREVSSYDLAELQAFKPNLATMQQAIEFVAKQVVIQFEIKPNEPVESVVAVIQTYLGNGWSPSDFLVSSRDFQLLKTVKRLAPEIPLSVIHPWSGVIAVWQAKRLGTKRISMNEHVMWSFFIRSMSRRGWLLCGYTMDDPERARRWDTYGLHAVITDYPDLFDTASTT